MNRCARMPPNRLNPAKTPIQPVAGTTQSTIKPTRLEEEPSFPSDHRLGLAGLFPSELNFEVNRVGKGVFGGHFFVDQWLTQTVFDGSLKRGLSEADAPPLQGRPLLRRGFLEQLEAMLALAARLF